MLYIKSHMGNERPIISKQFYAHIGYHTITYNWPSFLFIESSLNMTYCFLTVYSLQNRKVFLLNETFLDVVVILTLHSMKKHSIRGKYLAPQTILSKTCVIYLCVIYLFIRIMEIQNINYVLKQTFYLCSIIIQNQIFQN